MFEIGPLRMSCPKDCRRSSLGVCPYIPLPKPQDFPAGIAKETPYATVPIYVASYLCDPVGGVVAGGQFLEPPLKVAAVPEISITKNCQTSHGNYQVRTSW
jgi:hypothetical protein